MSISGTPESTGGTGGAGGAGGTGGTGGPGSPDGPGSERFAQIYRDHFDAVVGFALRRADRPEDAADVTAETFLVVWRRLRHVPGGAETRPWLYGVARRVLANQRRGEGRRTALGQRLREQLPSAVAVGLSEGRAQLLEEIMAQPATQTDQPDHTDELATAGPGPGSGDGRTRWTRWALPVAAAAAVAAVVAVPQLVGDDTAQQSEELPAAAAPGSGEIAVLDVTGWELDGVGVDAEYGGELDYRNGRQELEISWRPADSYDDYVTDRDDIGPSEQTRPDVSRGGRGGSPSSTSPRCCGTTPPATTPRSARWSATSPSRCGAPGWARPGSPPCWSS